MYVGGVKNDRMDNCRIGGSIWYRYSGKKRDGR